MSEGWECYSRDRIFSVACENEFINSANKLCVKNPKLIFYIDTFPYTIHVVFNCPLQVGQGTRKFKVYEDGELLDEWNVPNRWDYLVEELTIHGKVRNKVYECYLINYDGKTIKKHTFTATSYEDEEIEVPDQGDTDTDYSELIKAIKNIPKETSKLTEEQADEIIDAIKNAQVIKSSKDVVSDAELNAAINLTGARINSSTREIKDEIKDNASEITDNQFVLLTQTTGIRNQQAESTRYLDSVMYDNFQATRGLIVSESEHQETNIIGKLESSLAGSTSSILNKIHDLGKSITGIDMPEIPNIENLYNNLVNKINSLEFPTLDSIKNVFIEAADTVAEKIINKILDEIERRYK